MCGLCVAGISYKPMKDRANQWIDTNSRLMTQSGHVLAVLDDAFSGFRSPDHVAGVPAEGKRVKAAANPDQATAQTVEIMCQHIHASAKDPLISRYALEAVTAVARRCPVREYRTGCALRSARNRGKHLVVV